jgi:dedicator of cytokinesis protein 3
LALDVGDFVEIIEEFGLWFRGTCSTKSKAVGIFPKSYIHLKDKNKSDPVVVECTEVLRNWNEIWKRLFVVSTTEALTASRMLQ